MEIGCDEEMLEGDIKKFVSDEIYEKYQRFKRNIKVEQDENLKWCSKKDCELYVTRQKATFGGWERKAKCACGQEVCFLCGGDFHSGLCDVKENKELQEYFKRYDVKESPCCGNAIERPFGCNLITCAKCKVKWCWLCRETDIEYRHFNSQIAGGC